MKSSHHHALEVLGYVALSTALSVSMALFHKWFLHAWTGTGYPFATTVSCIHMFVDWLISHLLQRRNSAKHPTPVIPRGVYWKLAVPIGLSTGFDVMFSNLSFLYITVTFFTIVKSFGNVLTLIFAVWIGHQRASWPLALVVVLICGGIALSSYGSTSFDIRGFLLVLAASIAGSLRWVLTQSLLKVVGDEIGSTTKTKSLTVTYLSCPASALGLLPFTLAMDGKALLQSKFMREPDLISLSMLFNFGGGVLGFAMLLVRVILVEKTSALTLGVSYSVRDITQISLAVVLFGDILSAINIVGLAVATCGILLYSLLREKSKKQQSEEEEQELAKTDPYRLSEITPVTKDRVGGRGDQHD